MLTLSTKPRPPVHRNPPAYELDLIAAAQRGDISAFNQLVRAYQELAYRVAFHLLDDRHTAEVVTGRTCEVAYRQIRHCKGAAFKIWLLQILIQQCRRTDKFSHAVASGPRLPVELGLQTLSMDERIICVLGDVVGLTEQEISQITRLPAAVLRVKRGQARRQLRDVLGIYGSGIGKGK
jgi:RNA polymerase sigma-70 factor (ECF subfamily)